uniref:Uncharacterized protein n=1 Tax=Plectus sambesii TaxID=2011161 RepID=A0A914WRC4_9BILA
MYWWVVVAMGIIYSSLFFCCGLSFYLFGWSWLYNLYCCRRVDVARDRIEPIANLFFMRYGDHNYLQPEPRRLGDLEFGGNDEIVIWIPRVAPRYMPSMPRC